MDSINPYFNSTYNSVIKHAPADETAAANGKTEKTETPKGDSFTLTADSGAAAAEYKDMGVRLKSSAAPFQADAGNASASASAGSVVGGPAGIVSKTAAEIGLGSEKVGPDGEYTDAFLDKTKNPQMHYSSYQEFASDFAGIFSELELVDAWHDLGSAYRTAPPPSAEAPGSGKIGADGEYTDAFLDKAKNPQNHYSSYQEFASEFAGIFSELELVDAWHDLGSAYRR